MHFDASKSAEAILSISCLLSLVKGLCVVVPVVAISCGTACPNPYRASFTRYVYSRMSECTGHVYAHWACSYLRRASVKRRSWP